MYFLHVWSLGDLQETCSHVLRQWKTQKCSQRSSPEGELEANKCICVCVHSEETVVSRYKPCEVLPCQPGREEHLKCVYFVSCKIDGEQRNVQESRVSGSLNQYYERPCINQLPSLVSRIFCIPL